MFPAEPIGLAAPAASSPSLLVSVLAIALGASADEDGAVEVDEVVDLDVAGGAVVDAEVGSESPALYEREEVPPVESLAVTGAPFRLSLPGFGRLGEIVGLVAPGVVSTLDGALLIGLLGFCVCAETGSDDKSDTKLSVTAVSLSLLNCRDPCRLVLWFIGPFQAFPKLTPT